VFKWYFRTSGGESDLSTGGGSFENILHPNIGGRPFV
jgi:hypothetical protein